ncbi:hypothetical protein EUA04_20795 [Mycolicibacterium obuense]|uniref:Uncharacterized protein n=1 Tax=Mycolicibacterium obuense TaxID=1807 RepID=A0A4R5X256_9MYCO|nr:hypothetical protein [Mycolicibacterium obuense]TDL04997.1 hypothetical protein EUA04_20795 [Mycolicibacterium obuense]
MTHTPPAAQHVANDRDRRSARRAAARAHHPDRGGSAADLIAALAEIDRQADGAPPLEVVLIIRRPRRARLHRWLYQWRRRHTSRRYFTL